MGRKNLKQILNSIKDTPRVHKHPAPKQKKTTYRYKLTVSVEEKILLIGEGNFSFSLSLAERHGRADNMIATAFDTHETTIKKYPDSEENIGILKDLEAQVLFEVDATKLSTMPLLKKQKFDKIIFNFPHVGLGIKDQNENVMANQRLLIQFFKEARMLLKQSKQTQGQIIVTLKTGMPYDLWNIKQLAKDNNLKLDRSMEFNPADFPGYAHRRTLGFDENISAADNSEITKRPSRTYVFTKK